VRASRKHSGGDAIWAAEFRFEARGAASEDAPLVAARFAAAVSSALRRSEHATLAGPYEAELRQVPLDNSGGKSAEEFSLAIAAYVSPAALLV
jgi:hypothetical protein